MHRRWPQWRTRGWLGDLLLAAAVATLAVTELALDPEAGPAPNGWDYALLLATGGALALRRRAPVAVLLFTGAAAPVAYANGPTSAFVIAPFAIALYTLAVRGRSKLAIAAAVLGVGAIVDVTSTGFWTAAWFGGALVLAEMTRTRRAYLAEVERRAHEAERTREEEARRRAGEERLRIARELHDVLAHSLSVISVQAGVAAHLLAKEPQRAEAALLAIKETSKEALFDLRQTLGMLRDIDGEAPREPAPSLARIDELIARIAPGGLEVDVVHTGTPRALPATVDLAAYRIVQESLTNVARHAHASRTTVTIDYQESELVIRIEDDGRGVRAAAVGGDGIGGMRERAAASGGELEAGPLAEGGFRVRARLPIEAAA